MGDLPEQLDRSAGARPHPLALTVVVGAVLLVWGVFLVRAPLSESFWLDETITAWIVKDSLREVWSRSIQFQGQSPLYYMLVWPLHKFLHGVLSAEVALRMLSVVGGFGAAALLWQLVGKFSKSIYARALAVSVVVADPLFQNAVLSARPYALAVVAALWSVVCMLGLCEKFSRRRAAVWAISLVVTFYLHYLFAVVVLVHGVVLLVWHRPTARAVLPWVVVFGVCALPGAFQLSSLAQRAPLLSFSQQPELRDLLLEGVPLPVLVPFVTGLLLAAIWGGGWRALRTVLCVPPVLLTYAVLPVCIFFVHGCVSDAPLWMPRYWAWSSLIWSVVCGVVTGAVQGLRTVAILCTVTFVMVATFLGVQQRAPEEWREAAGVVRGAQGSVVLLSGLIEAEHAALRTRAEYAEYLRVPLTVYGVSQPIVVVGAHDSDAELAKALRTSELFVLFGGEKIRRRALQLEGVTLTPLLQGRTVAVFRVREVVDRGD